MNADQAKKLREPFPAEMVGKLPKPTKKDNPKGKCAECGGWHGLPAIHLDYVGHAATTDRLLQVDPEWTWEPAATDESGLPIMLVHGETRGLWIKMTVAGVTRYGFGDGPTIKECISDAIRNAAMRFGVALDLWSKEDLQADLERESESHPGAGNASAPVPAEDPTAGARLGTNDVSMPEASTAQVARLRSKIGELRKLAPDDEYVRWWDGFSIGEDGKKLSTAVLQKKLLPSKASAGIDKVQARIAELALGEPVEPELPTEPFPEPDAEKVAAFNEVAS